MWRAGPLNLEARTNILKSDKSDLCGVDKADSSLCAFGVNAQIACAGHELELYLGLKT